MTLYEAYIQGLEHEGMSRVLAQATVDCYRSKNIINSKVWERDALAPADACVLAGYNGVRNVTISQLNRFLKGCEWVRADEGEKLTITIDP